VISIFLSKSKYFKTSSIKDLISSTERIEGVPPPKYKEKVFCFLTHLFLEKFLFLKSFLLSASKK
jgi:hypothetical protein